MVKTLRSFFACILFILPAQLTASDNASAALMQGTAFFVALVAMPFFNRYIEREQAKLGEDNFSHAFLKRLQPAHARTMQQFLAQYTPAQLDKRIIRPKKYRDMRFPLQILHWLAIYGDSETAVAAFKHLVDRGCNITALNTKHLDPREQKDSLLHSLCRHNESATASSPGHQMLLYLVQKKADVNARNDNGETPLLVCGHSRIVFNIDASIDSFHNARALIEAGADLDAADINNTTALTSALSMSRSDTRGLYQLLLIAGAQRLHPDDYTDKVIHGTDHLSCLHASYPELVQIIEEIPHFIPCRNDEERTKLRTRLLTTQEHAEIMRKRLVNLTDPEQRLACAVRLHCLEQASAHNITQWKMTDDEEELLTALTTPQETLEYILRSRRARLQRFKTSWHTVAEVAPLVQQLEEDLPRAISDMVLDYALIPGPILQKPKQNPSPLAQKEKKSHEDDE